MTEINSSGNIPPEALKQYQQEYKKGVDLFQQALEKEHTSTGAQKEKFQKVMEEAANVMKETAKAVCRNAKQKEKEKVFEKDLDRYLETQDPKDYAKVHKDIQDIREGLR